MVKETLRLLTDALNHPTYGVNIQLDQIAGSTAPNVTAYDETRNDQVAMGHNAEPYPSLNVVLAEPANMQGEVHTSLRDGISLPIAIGYVGRNTDSAEGVCHLWDTIRAVQFCLRDWLRNENAADRELNNVQVVSCTEISVLPNMVGPNDALVPGGLIATLYVRDVYPS